MASGSVMSRLVLRISFFNFPHLKKETSEPIVQSFNYKSTVCREMRVADLQMPSGIISRQLSAALNTSSSLSFPMPAGIPLKSTWLLLMKSLRSRSSLHSEPCKRMRERCDVTVDCVYRLTLTGSSFSLFRERFKYSKSSQLSVNRITCSINIPA